MAEHLHCCATCVFFVPGRRPSTVQHDGSCHVYPPGNYNTPLPDDGTDPTPADDDGYTMLVTIADTTYTGWPIILASDWCGQHEPRKQPATPRKRAAA